MKTLIKLLCAVAYAFAFFLGVPCLIVGTCMLYLGLFGNAWWVGLLLAPVILVEFIAGLSFFAWEDNPVPRWFD